MALSGDIYGSTNNRYITACISWSAIPSIDTNSSIITATLYLYKDSSYENRTRGTGTWYLTIDGNSTGDSKHVELYTSAGWVTILSHSVTVPHDEDGNKSVTITGSGGIPNTTYTSTSVSATVSLDRIDRPSRFLTIDRFIVENPFDILITKYDQTFSDDLEIYHGETLVKKIDDYNSGDPILLSIDELSSVYSLVDISESQTSVSFNLITYNSEGAIIGNDSCVVDATLGGTAYLSVGGDILGVTPIVFTEGKWVRLISIVRDDTDWVRLY